MIAEPAGRRRTGLLDVPSPHPLAEALPAPYRERLPKERALEQDEDASDRDDRTFAQRLTAALDDVLAPIFCCLDNIASYLDPWLAPEDFLDWLAGWLGVELDENWPLGKRREHVARAVELHRRRGTARGLAEYLELFAGAPVDVVEHGGTSWSTTPEGPLPGAGDPHASIRVRIDDPSFVDLDRLHALAKASAPAHVVVEVEASSP